MFSSFYSLKFCLLASDVYHTCVRSVAAWRRRTRKILKEKEIYFRKSVKKWEKKKIVKSYKRFKIITNFFSHFALMKNIDRLSEWTETNVAYCRQFNRPFHVLNMLFLITYFLAIHSGLAGKLNLTYISKHYPYKICGLVVVVLFNPKKNHKKKCKASLREKVKFISGIWIPQLYFLTKIKISL